MGVESRPIPKVARTAIRFAQNEYAAALNALALEILEAMALSAADGWAVDFATGTARRETATDSTDG